MPVEEQTAGISDYWRIGFPETWRAGQLLTIPDREVIKLGFWLRKFGSPTGNVTLTIRKNSDKSIIVSKLWGTADGISTGESYCEVEFDTPTLINEVALILAEGDWISTTNYLKIRAVTPSVKADEYFVRFYDVVWDPWVDYDCAYRYTYNGGVPQSANMGAKMIAEKLI